MKLTSVTYDESQEFNQVTVTMTRNEVFAIEAILGKLNGHAHQRLNIGSSAYDCLNRVINSEYEEGNPVSINLATINSPL